MTPDLPEVALEALDQVRCGARARSVESNVLDFKEDPAHADGGRGRGGNPDARVIEVLLDASVCFANGSGGDAFVVLGVCDTASGPGAFTGTERNPEWIQKKIFDKTVPSLRVEARVFEYCGARLILISVPEGLSVYSRRDGAASRRIDTACIPLTVEDRRQLAYERANPDMTNRPSSLSVDDLDPIALARGRDLLATKRRLGGDSGAVPDSPAVLLRELGLLTDEGGMTVAAELMFRRRSPGEVCARHLYRSVPSGEPAATELGGALVLVFEELTEAVRRHGDAEIARVELPGGQETAVPAFPARAVDEVVANAIVHRDWAMTRPVEVDQSPRILKVWSPGALPYGVDADRLLTTPSIPRNSRLMSAMRGLGLVEETSRGFVRMWVAMLSTGRPAPEVDTGELHVAVTLVASMPDTTYVAGVARMADAFGPDVIYAVNTLIVLWHLRSAPLMTLRQVRDQTQVNELEARENMAWLVEVGVVQYLTERRDEWVLTSRALTVLGSAVSGGVASVSVQDWIEERLRSGEPVTNRQVVEATGASAREVTQLLTHLRQLGRAGVDPSGPSRGTTVRWIAPGPG